ncbi:hypothetical protein HanPSC8_Chr10g0423521 [Helianthus annuus]|nr:hypothetical protein HanPSC8_Chr10g0423521 [Helianthus annuus]
MALIEVEAEGGYKKVIWLNQRNQKSSIDRGLFMDPMNITFLNHLDVSKDIYTIKVRIIKLWRQPSFKVPPWGIVCN